MIENQRKEGQRNDRKNEVRHHLHEVVKEAFSDAIQQDFHHDHGTDEFRNGVAESGQKIILLGERIGGLNVSNFCGSLANQKFFHVPVNFRDAIHFKPTKQIPIPVSNLTVLLPSRWFRDAEKRSPTVFVCYEGDSFLKMHQVKTIAGDWQSQVSNFQRSFISDTFNERCRIREIMVVLDDFWNKRNLLPRNLEGRVIIETSSFLPRVTFDGPCDPQLGLDQPCCLWKFHVDMPDGSRREFHRCFGSIPAEAVKSNQIPEVWADILLRGGMTRRFLSPPTRVCREIEFNSMVVTRPDGINLTMKRLDATKCGAFF